MNGLLAPATLFVRSVKSVAATNAPRPVANVTMPFLLTKTLAYFVPLMLRLKPMSTAPLLVSLLKGSTHEAGSVADAHCVLKMVHASPPVLLVGGVLSRPKSMNVRPACASGATASSRGSSARAPAALARWDVVMKDLPWFFIRELYSL